VYFETKRGGKRSIREDKRGREYINKKSTQGKERERDKEK
jgi:hypothetical protein